MRITSSLLCLLLFGASWALPTQADECPPDRRWGLVVDAGSSGSRLYYYCWSSGARGELPIIEDHGSFKREPGIADTACRLAPGDAADSLRPLLDAAITRVGDDRLSSTPISLLATGGLRQCSVAYQEQTLAAIRSLFDETPFLVDRVDLIDGREEALFGWTAVNYLLGRLDGDRPTVGALDLGGASTQITFESARCDPSASPCREVTLDETPTRIYSHSYLGWGQDEAMREVGSRACSVRGYRETATSPAGRGRFAACKRAIRRTMKRDVRSRPPAPSCSSSCNRLATYQPPVGGEFIAFSAFAYTADFLGLASTSSLADFERAGRKHCSTPWHLVESKCAAAGSGRCDPYFLNRYCFSAAYIVTLLHDVYGFPLESSGVTSTNQLDGFQINWTLGAMLRLAQNHGDK